VKVIYLLWRALPLSCNPSGSGHGVITSNDVLMGDADASVLRTLSCVAHREMFMSALSPKPVRWRIHESVSSRHVE
jgi:hypothetical protein